MKKPHYVVVVQRTFSKPPVRSIIVPCESFRSKVHWDSKNNRLRYFVNYILAASKYSGFSHDTIAECSQIFTIDSKFLTDYKFTLDDEDIQEILKRMVWIIGL